MDGITIVFSILAAILGLYYLLFRNLSYFKDNGIPHIPPLPIVGNFAPILLRRMAATDLMQKLYNLNRDAKYVGLYFMTRPIILIRDIELMKSIMVKNFERFPDHWSAFDEEQDPLVANNLVALQGKRWKEVRTLMSSTFTASKIRGMFKLIESCASDYADYFVDLPESKREMDMTDVLPRFTNNVIGRCAFGIKVDCMRNPDDRFYKYGMEVTRTSNSLSARLVIMSILPKLGKWLKLRLIRKEIADFFENVVKDIVEERERTGLTQPDMIQVMMDSRDKDTGLSVADMTSQAFIFYFGGFSTVSSFTCFMAHELAVNAGIQHRLQREIDEVLEATDGELSYEAINEMQYLEAVINETLRLYPIGFVTDRVCQRSFELPPALPGMKPLLVEKGTNVWLSPYTLQRDPKYFEEPNKFNPDRFLDKEKNLAKSAAYIPFGSGPRMCIGNRFALLEVKVLFFYLLARCNLRPCSKTTDPLEMSKKLPMAAEKGFWMKIEARSDLWRKSTY